MGLFGFLFQRRPGPPTEAPLVATVVAASHTDPRTSGPHLDLLCYFLEPKAALQKLSEDWPAALGDTSAEAVRRLVRLELLAPVSLEAKLDRTQSVADLRAQLKARALPVSGNKPVLVARLVAADETGAAALVSTFDAYDCTPAGEELAKRRLDAVAEQKAAAVARSRALIQAGDYGGALDVACAFKASHKLKQHHIASPFAIRDTRDPVEAMIAFATARPKLFGKLPEETSEALRVAAAMDRLWGGWLAPWLPEGLERVGRFGPGAAYVMLVGYDNFLRLTRAGVRRGTFVCVSNCCAACSSLDGKLLLLSDIQELPYPKCQNAADGCRCLVRPELSFGE